MFQKVFQRQALLMKALANPKRLEVAQLLSQGQLTVSQMERMLGIRQANISQHLMVLRRQGVVVTKRRGKEIYYSLAHPNFTRALELVRAILMKTFGGEIARAAYSLQLVIDPICGMKLTPANAAQSYFFGGKRYYFCGAGCVREFKKNRQGKK